MYCFLSHTCLTLVKTGPVGLAAVVTAQLYSPRQIAVFDRDEYRLDVAKKFGATHTFNTKDNSDVRSLAKEHFGEADGFDVVMEAVGIPETFDMCQQLVGLGGHIANIGVHGKPVNLQIDRLWPRSTTISMALVSAHTIPTLLDLYAAGKLDANAMVTHGTYQMQCLRSNANEFTQTSSSVRLRRLMTPLERQRRPRV